jgi:hypothetical protein
MSNQDCTLLTSELEKNEQFCQSLKTLIQNGCSRETLSVLAEELCDNSESIRNRFGTFNQGD